jgi:putative acetyltransferase
MTSVRPEAPADLPAIRAIHEMSFPTRAEGRLVDALRVAGRLSVSLVAEVDRVVVAHIAFSPVTASVPAPGVGLAPVAVLPRERGRGVGARLICEGLAACARAGFAFAVVLGDPEYYSRFGFRPAAAWGMVDEYEGGEAFQARELQAGGIPPGIGVVRYAPEFAALETP